MRAIINHGLRLNNQRIYTCLKISSFFATGPSKPLSYYIQVLGLKQGYTPDELKSAYLEMVKKYHPDLSKDPNAVQKFQQVQVAYDILQEAAKNKKEQPSQTIFNRRKDQKPLNNQQPGDKEAAEQFQKTFRQIYSRKKNADESMQFSYNLYKKHYQKYQEKKKEYIKYAGHQREQWQHKNEKKDPIWPTVGMSALMIGLASGAIYFVNLK